MGAVADPAARKIDQSASSLAWSSLHHLNCGKSRPSVLQCLSQRARSSIQHLQAACSGNESRSSGLELQRIGAPHLPFAWLDSICQVKLAWMRRSARFCLHPICFVSVVFIFLSVFFWRQKGFCKLRWKSDGNVFVNKTGSRVPFPAVTSADGIRWRPGAKTVRHRTRVRRQEAWEKGLRRIPK